MNYSELVISKSPNLFHGCNVYSSGGQNLPADYYPTGVTDYVASGGYTEPSYTIKKHGVASYYYHEGGRESRYYTLPLEIGTVHLEFWIYIPVVNNATDQVIFRFNGETGANVGTFASEVRLLGTRAIAWRTQGFNSSTNLDTINSSTVIPLATWTHVACTFSGQKNSKKIYINGVLSQSGNAGTSQHKIHGRFHLPDTPIHQRFYLDSVAVWAYSAYDNELPPLIDIQSRVSFPEAKTRYYNTSKSGSTYAHDGFQFTRAGDERYWTGTQWESFTDKVVQYWNGSSWVTI
jgi:hypothetical protein